MTKPDRVKHVRDGWDWRQNRITASSSVNLFFRIFGGYCFLPEYPAKNTFLDPLESGYPDFSQGPSETIGGMHVLMISKSPKGFTLFCTWNLALNFSHTFLVIKSHLYMV